ncbi:MULTISPECIES: NADPH-dependent FMN reductase [Sinorhizobium]|uniref:NADPH-dependent FMN reductase protein n=1 Tax=Rhizobium fredii TaxID=380 RepID=A0A2L0HD86_RHIFR|nr:MULTISPECIES: NADPH-dependent FMN reductase [Sinorhizobium]AUX79377.1 NADPH-dependent FMN reductase protein [Sinorhizobium fredii]WEJ08399.1 NAD(P)H-dependent oxidoreductase [Sinorhizobium sp. M103]WEJ14094.1 NAD(P)H-dependent oxidoreductase [Sinorhizobium sp. K101]WEJ35696.1 NAD(P)H-dependent oxidoreductase [Sinorhizobium sp. C101]
MKIVAITGNLTRPSKTRAVADYVVGRARSCGDVVNCWDLVDLHPHLGATIWPSDAAENVKAALEDVATSDLLIVGSPVYKASYTGLLKHFFDLIDMKALKGRHIIAFATGKAPAHGPLVEVSMRALFDFFDAQIDGKFIFALDEDFDNAVLSENLRAAVDDTFDNARRAVSAWRAGGYQWPFPA